MRQFQSKKRYLYALLIGTVIFIIGFAITYSVAYIEYQRVISLQDPISYQIFQDKIQYTLFGEDICSDDSYLKISKDLSTQGSFIADIEDKLGKENKNVLFRKKFYTLIELEHFEFIKSINQECNKSINTILFFYSNNPSGIKKSEKTGAILSTLYNKNEDNLIIYSFDINLNSEIINLLKEKYNITQTPTIIINEQHIINDLSNINQIQPLLN